MELPIVIIVVVGTLVIVYFSYQFYMLYRVDKVYKFRREILDRVSTAVRKDIERAKEQGLQAMLNLDWMWRYQYFEKVSFHTMLYSHKRLVPENFYDDLSFMEGNNEKVDS